MFHFLRIRLWLFLLLSVPFLTAAQQPQPENFSPITSSILQPVYGPLAEQIVSDFDLAKAKGVGIDLGSGPGDLIVELCRRTLYLHWINADINPRFFPGFIQKASASGFESRVSAIYADAQKLPFRDDYAQIVVSRGSFQFWKDQTEAFKEIYRVLKPGGVAFVGRGFSENLPVEVARKIRDGQDKRKINLNYSPADTAKKLKSIMKSLSIEDYKIRIPKSAGSAPINYGIWLEFHKPPLQE
jgi:SAM-dependent methyltransferase